MRSLIAPLRFFWGEVTKPGLVPFKGFGFDTSQRLIYLLFLYSNFWLLKTVAVICTLVNCGKSDDAMFIFFLYKRFCCLFLNFIFGWLSSTGLFLFNIYEMCQRRFNKLPKPLPFRFIGLHESMLFQFFMRFYFSESKLTYRYY